MGLFEGSATSAKWALVIIAVFAGRPAAMPDHSSLPPETLVNVGVARRLAVFIESKNVGEPRSVVLSENIGIFCSPITQNTPDTEQEQGHVPFGQGGKDNTACGRYDARLSIGSWENKSRHALFGLVVPVWSSRPLILVAEINCPNVQRNVRHGAQGSPGVEYCIDYLGPCCSDQRYVANYYVSNNNAGAFGADNSIGAQFRSTNRFPHVAGLDFGVSLNQFQLSLASLPEPISRQPQANCGNGEHDGEPGDNAFVMSFNEVVGPGSKDHETHVEGGAIFFIIVAGGLLTVVYLYHTGKRPRRHFPTQPLQGDEKNKNGK